MAKIAGHILRLNFNSRIGLRKTIAPRRSLNDSKFSFRFLGCDSFEVNLRGTRLASFKATVKQILLFKKEKYPFRKVGRSISTREFNHVIYKSRVPLLRRNHALVKRIIRDAQVKWGIQIKALAIMENHIHMAVKTPTRTALQHFMRHSAGVIALKLGKGRIWTKRAWSRVVKAGRDLTGVLGYIHRNPSKAEYWEAQIDIVAIEKGILTLRP